MLFCWEFCSQSTLRIRCLVFLTETLKYRGQAQLVVSNFSDQKSRWTRNSSAMTSGAELWDQKSSWSQLTSTYISQFKQAKSTKDTLKISARWWKTYSRFIVGFFHCFLVNCAVRLLSGCRRLKVKKVGEKKARKIISFWWASLAQTVFLHGWIGQFSSSCRFVFQQYDPVRN